MVAPGGDVVSVHWFVVNVLNFGLNTPRAHVVQQRGISDESWDERSETEWRGASFWMQPFNDVVSLSWQLEGQAKKSNY